MNLFSRIIRTNHFVDRDTLNFLAQMLNRDGKVILTNKNKDENSPAGSIRILIRKEGKNGLRERCFRVALEQEEVCTCKLGFLLVVGINGIQYHLDTRPGGFDLLGGLQPVLDGHVDVHQYKVRLIFADQLNRFRSIGSLPDDGYPGLKGQ